METNKSIKNGWIARCSGWLARVFMGFNGSSTQRWNLYHIPVHDRCVHSLCLSHRNLEEERKKDFCGKTYQSSVSVMTLIWFDVPPKRVAVKMLNKKLEWPIYKMSAKVTMS